MSGIAEIGIRVFLDNVAAGGLAQLAGQLNQITTNSQNATTQMRLMQEAAVAGAFVGFGVALLGVGEAVKYSIDAATEFQTAMFGIAVATHVPMSEAMTYTNTLMNLGATSTYTSTEIAAGIAAMGRSGYSLHDIMTQVNSQIPSMAQAGIALGIATRTTAVEGFTMLSQAMSAYQAKAPEAIHYADLLQFGFEHQRDSVANFRSGLAQVTPDAARFGISLKDVVAALDTISPGMKGTAQAGTALRYMIDGLLSPTKIAKSELVSLGLASVDAGGNFHSAFYDSNGNAKDLTTILQILSGKMKGMSEEARTNALHSLFSVRGGQGADILLQQMSKYMGYLDQLNKSGDNANGALNRQREVMNTVAGATSALTTSIRDLGVAVGLQLLPVITNILTAANGAVSGIRTWALANASAIPLFLGLAGAIAIAGLAVTGIMLMMANPVILVFVAAMLAATVGSFALAAGITALIGWFRSLMAGASPLANLIRFIIQVFQALGAELMGQVQWGMKQVQLLLKQTGVDFSGLATLGKLLMYVLGAIAIVLVGVLVAALHAVVTGLVWFVTGLAITLAGVAQWVSGIIQFFHGLFIVIHGILTGNSAMIQQGFAMMGAGIVNALKGMLMAVLGVFVAVFGGIIGFIVGFVQGAIQWFQHLSTVLVGHSIVPDMMNAIHAVIVSVLTAVVAFIVGIVTNIISTFQRFANTTQQVVSSAFNLMRSVVSNVLQGIVALISGDMAQAQAHFQAAGQTIISTMTNAMNSMRNAVSNGINAAMTFFSGLPGRITGALAGLGAMLFSSGATAMQQFAAGLGSAIGAVVSQVQQAAGAVANFLAHHSPAKLGPLSDDDKWMPNMMSMFAQGIKQHAPLVTGAVQGMATNMASIPSQTRLTTPAQGGGVTGPSGNTYITLQLDGTPMANLVINKLTGQLSSNGLGRVMR